MPRSCSGPRGAVPGFRSPHNAAEKVKSDMFKRRSQRVSRPPQPVSVTIDKHKTREIEVLTTQELERRRFYERLAHHQRITEIEEEQQRRF